MGRRRKKKKRQKKAQGPFSLKLLRWVIHTLTAAAVILIFLSLVQCTIKKPESPTWDTKLTLPLVSETWDMPTLIDKIDQENLQTDADGNPIFYYEKTLDTVYVSGSFAAANVYSSVSEALGVFDLDPIAPAAMSIQLSDYVSLIAGDVPPASFDIIDTLPAYGDFTSATVQSGSASFSLQNNFGLDLDTLIYEIYDLASGSILTTENVAGGLAAGASLNRDIDLSGRTISNRFELVLRCHTPGATALSLSDKSLDADLSMPYGLSVTAATAKIPRIERNFGQDLDINSAHVVQSAELQSGQLIIDIANNTNVEADLVLSIPDIKDGGASLVVNQHINPGVPAQVFYDLSGYTLEIADQVPPQSIPVTVNAVIDSTAPYMATVTSTDNIDVAAQIQNIAFQSVTGIIAPTTADFVNVTQSIEVPKGFDSLQFVSAVLDLGITNTVDIPGSFSITIDGDNGKQIILSGQVAPGTPAAPSVTHAADSAIASFLFPVPQSFSVSGSATFGDGSTSGSVNQSDFVSADVVISSPLEVIIAETTIDGDWQSENINQEDIGDIIDNFKSARFYFSFLNHLPLGVSASILFSGDSASLYTNPEVVVGPIDIMAGQVGPDGTVIQPEASENVVPLDSAQIDTILRNPTLYIGELITLHSSGGNPVKLSASDSVRITGYIEVDFTFDGDF